MSTKAFKKQQPQELSPPVPLDREARRVLSSVFRASDPDNGGVDVAKYRVAHKNQWDALAEMEQAGYLRKENSLNKYFLSLVGISQLGGKRPKRLLANAEKIFAELRKRYTTDPHAMVTLTSIETSTGIALGAVRESLSYMTELSIWSGHNLTNDRVDVREMYILPNENVVAPKYRRFRDLIAERIRLNEEQRKHVRYATPDDLLGGVVRPGTQRDKTGKSWRSDQHDWYRHLKPGIRSLMEEIGQAIGVNARTLAAMGLRAVVDMACNDVLEDIGGFDKKLMALQDSGWITAAQRRTLASTVELGHAAAHRGHMPSRKQIDLALDIVEHLLKQLYLHEPASEELRRGVPVRKRASSNNKK